ncbi:MAG: HDOD domain-containing protein [Zoogloea sp.]|nr:HDOD domain-containing protein [Zoogloea sp.]
MNFLNKPLDSSESYVAFFCAQSLPVLKRTARELAAMREKEETVNGRSIAGVVLADPLLTLRVLTFMEARRRAAQNHDITTVERAVMMMGISPFLKEFADLPTIEDQLGANPKALLGVLKVIARARRAAKYARDWAMVRHDLDVDEITVAALLYEVCDILCWCFAPELTERVYAMQRADRKLRSTTAQRIVFNFTAREIQDALVRAWGLPDLLVAMMNKQQVENPRVRTVLLANNLARHTGSGWENPALPDDLAAIEGLLHVSRETLLHRLQVPEPQAGQLLAAGGSAIGAMPSDTTPPAPQQ